MCGEAKQNVKPHMGIFFILISIPKAQSAVRAREPDVRYGSAKFMPFLCGSLKM